MAAVLPGLSQASVTRVAWYTADGPATFPTGGSGDVNETSGGDWGVANRTYGVADIELGAIRFPGDAEVYPRF